MFPFSQGQPDQGGGNLEDRLRGLILNNANASPVPNNGQQSPVTSQLPPHMLRATPAEKEEYLAKAASNSGSQSPSIRAAQPSPGRQKRPNQAQRRQMNSQIAIPIDTRSNHAAPVGRGPGSFGGHLHSQHHVDQPGYQTQKYPQQHQPYSPRYQNAGVRAPHTQPVPLPANNTHPQTQQYQLESKPNNHSRQGPNNFQQQYQQTPYGSRLPPQGRQLFQSGPYNGQGRGRPFGHNSEEIAVQTSYLEKLLQECVSIVGMEPQEKSEKEAFRATIENICQESIAQFERQELGNERFDASSVELQCFGSMKSGFATRASDMDLALLTPKSEPAPDSPESRIPRLLEKKLLGLGYGARLLTRTRVPIIKLCQKPTEKLHSDLLEERAKWDNGATADLDDEDEDDHEAESITRSEKTAKHKSADSQLTPSPSSAAPKNPEASYESKLSSLKQKEQQSLGDYYNSAKRLLRKLGGRDITASSPDLNEQESKILNGVCRAFVLGLVSEALSTRLRRYQSIQPLFDSTLPFIQRSIHGVWVQVEGERLAMAWDSRPLTELNDRFELESLDAVEAWRILQDKIGIATEPVFYNRQLFAASEKLKKINSLQLVFLEQLPYEEPIFYHKRAERIQNCLKGRELGSSTDSVTPIFIAHYVAGIRNQQIRESLRSGYGEGTLEQVAHEHLRLQLAADYEHAMNIKFFHERDIAVVEQYTTLLRSHTTKELAIIFAKPDSPETALTAKVRTLPDPTQVSLLKPRDRYKDHLEFPKSDIGIQCDINFSAHLAIHNTQLLRCYSFSDPRVKPMILFIKHWAKVRGINTPYRGTLSSYGYVLMVLHYLVNIAQPFVCPNLQLVNKDPPHYLPPAEIEARTICDGRDVRFWRNEAEIKNLADRKMLNHNHDSLGFLLRGFFEYYAQNGPMTTVQARSFDWGREVLSLKTPGGVLTKQEKGWVGAKTVVETTTIAAPPMPKKSGDLREDSSQVPEGATPEVKPAKQVKTMEETKEIRHRYLFAIEDPFELDHNVARTVTHNGIVSIRDEFRRAWRIIKGVGKDDGKEGLLDLYTGGSEVKGGLKEMMDMIHGPAMNIVECA